MVAKFYVKQLLEKHFVDLAAIGPKITDHMRACNDEKLLWFNGQIQLRQFTCNFASLLAFKNCFNFMELSLFDIRVERLFTYLYYTINF